MKRCIYRSLALPAIHAWTGGSAPSPFIWRDSQVYRALVVTEFRSQMTMWIDYWGDCPDKNTRNLFWNRARYDAWATMRAKGWVS